MCAPFLQSEMEKKTIISPEDRKLKAELARGAHYTLVLQIEAYNLFHMALMMDIKVPAIVVPVGLDEEFKYKPKLSIDGIYVGYAGCLFLRRVLWQVIKSVLLLESIRVRVRARLYSATSLPLSRVSLPPMLLKYLDNLAHPYLSLKMLLTTSFIL